MRRPTAFIASLIAALIASVPPQSVALYGPPMRWARGEDPEATETKAAGGEKSFPPGDSRRSLRPKAVASAESKPASKALDKPAFPTAPDPPQPDSVQQSIAITVRVAPANYRFAVAQNTPNPLRDWTVIRYSVGVPSNFSIKVYSVMGRHVATLVDRYHDAGDYTVQWEGVDDRGRRLPFGTYIYRAAGGPFVQTMKLIVQ